MKNKTTEEPPVLTIITVTSNHLDGLQKTYNSIIEQDQTCFPQIIWQVIDNASTDGTPQWLRSISADPPFITNMLSDPDDGLYHGMNKGLKRANGSYILFLNAGDCLANPKTLSAILKVVQEHTPDLIYGDTIVYQGAQHHLKPARSPDYINYGLLTHHQAIIYRRHILVGLNYDTRYRVAADYDFTLRVLKRCQSDSIYNMKRPICLFEGGGLSEQKSTLGRKENYLIRQRLQQIPGWKNGLIYCANTLSFLLKKNLPRLYRNLRYFKK